MNRLKAWIFWKLVSLLLFTPKTMQSKDGIVSKDDSNDTLVPTDMVNSSTSSQHSGMGKDIQRFNVHDLTLQFESNAISLPSEETFLEPFAHRRSVLRSCRPPNVDQTPMDSQSTRINEALAWQKTVCVYKTNPWHRTRTLTFFFLWYRIGTD
jgi:hypothetical protein